jgi:thymidylate synthase ThyX
VLESALRKMLSHPLAEVREMGQEIKRAARAEVPTLLKYADPAPYQSETDAALSQAARPGPSVPAAPQAAGMPRAELADYDPAAEDKFLAGCLYRYGRKSLAQCRAAVAGLTPAEKDNLAGEALGRLGKYDVPLRELEHVTYTFDLCLDQGAYFEIKRHRLMTQSPQALTADLGYVIPRAFEAAHFQADYEAAMQAAAAAYRVLADDFPAEASYVVPNGFKRRLLMTINLREAFHLCELRGAPNAHFSVRHLVGQMVAALAAVHPRLAAFMRCRQNPAWQDLEQEFYVPAAQ